MDQILFHFEEVQTNILTHPKLTQNWLVSVARDENASIEQLNYIFCTDEYLLQINQQFLNHDNYTDVITFPYSSSPIVADIYISIDRVEENYQQYGCTFQEELTRVMVHGLLHLVGYNDKSKDEVELMREKESAYLSLLLNT